MKQRLKSLTARDMNGYRESSKNSLNSQTLAAAFMRQKR
jgi:hypothetical protein